ncbi:aspartate/glutamate racemase family protein (plasmid) [Halorussus limi]|uniref:Aspartate/glutamate racemase family protein n=1 Tax=Halorussus limi TaxID=2938695 RepID=A0A8U0I1K6_9EURY|nr:aspartate/glutamate racemase family protein [Halorussus limi]UPV76771.1 aspartate/glutamate racemase family protein [Halorussus limi]
MARLGLVVPSSNTTAEPEFRAMAPDDSTVHAARMPLEDVTADRLDEMADGAERAAELLSHADVDGVAYACTTGSLLHGTGFDTELESRLSELTGAPAVATALSVTRALDELDVETLAVVTPYASELDELEREYLTESGFDVASIDGRGLVENTEIGGLTPSDAERQVRSSLGDDPDVDGVFVSCTNYRSLSALAACEERLGVPVVSSNLATMWDLGNRLGLDVDLSTSLV